ncbi:hypothetical protein KVR01_001347 [Diaporthe batatas]|uniref:uncharacterized protein n=1 Tax=Diaporthe batatas TaxID=748121 RepID=UPI001D049428|nr:uncharacterized protein KVR01_001347 [Diaporthe batatas]KAG8168598.1 hypothetical protein KVR01_001347 [Diaporthe batatas]
MLEANDIHNGVPTLLAVACLLLLSRYTSCLKGLWYGAQEDTARGIDGTKLYYGGSRWPQYEARFNLRLSYIYGPAFLISHPSTALLARLRRWLIHCVYGARDSSETTLLINSLSENERSLKALLGACASRRPSIAAGKYLSRGRRIVLQPYGPDWTRYRRAFTSLLTKEKISTRWTRALRHEAVIMVGRIAKLGNSRIGTDTTVLDEISRFTASSVLQITYARRAETPDDPILKDLRTVSQNIASAFTPGRYWVGDFPILDIFPTFISPWKRKLISDHHFEMALFKSLLHSVEVRPDRSQRAYRCNLPDQGENSVIAPEECAAAELLRKRDQLQLNQDDIAYLAAGIFEAGTETTAMTMNTFLLAAACYPEMTRRAQAELDATTYGKSDDEESLPEFTDLQHMTYLSAVVREALRLTPTGSSGVGRTLAKPGLHDLHLEDGVVGGDKTRVTIPSGGTVLANTYGLHHDRTRYPDPWRFNPDRWIATDSRQEPHPPGAQKLSPSKSYSLDHTHASFAFGFGRRICPGSSLASHSLSIAIALLLLCFDFELTDRAENHRHRVEELDREELRRFTELFPAGRNWAAMDWGRLHKEECTDPSDRLGRVLIDAYIAFKLSEEQLAECIRLEPRKESPWLKADGKL